MTISGVGTENSYYNNYSFTNASSKAGSLSRAEQTNFSGFKVTVNLEEDNTILKKNSTSQGLVEGKRAPYSYLAENDQIEYNGVVFQCDHENQTLNIGNQSNKNELIKIPLSDGGVLSVNRDNLGDLAHAIGMFSPEDVNRIMRAITLDTKIQEMQKEIEDVLNGTVAEQNTVEDVDSSQKSTLENKAEVEGDSYDEGFDNPLFENTAQGAQTSKNLMSEEITEEQLERLLQNDVNMQKFM